MKRILCFGDSNTWGLVAGTDNRYDWETRWTGRLQDALSGDGFQVVEEGLCGRTTVFDDVSRPGRSGAELLPVLLEAHAPLDLVILMLGTNDCKTVYDPTVSSISAGIDFLLGQIRDFSGDCEVLLLSPIELGDEVWREEFDPEFGKESVKVARALPSAYRELSGKWDISYLSASDYAKPSAVDQEHLDAEGHRNLADAVSKKVFEIFSQNGGTDKKQ